MKKNAPRFLRHALRAPESLDAKGVTPQNDTMRDDLMRLGATPREANENEI
jgi:hypothetical protein